MTTDPNEIVQCLGDGGLPIVPLVPELRRCEPEGYELVLKWEYIPPVAGLCDPYSPSQTGRLCAVPWVFVEASRFHRRNGGHTAAQLRAPGENRDRVLSAKTIPKVISKEMQLQTQQPSQEQPPHDAHQTLPAGGSEDQQAQQEQEEILLPPANQGMHAGVEDQQHL
jgi:hypothetical protein